MKKQDCEKNIKKVLKIITIVISAVTLIMSMLDILYFIGKSDIGILNITSAEYGTVIKALGYNTSMIVIPCILFTCLIYGLLTIGIIWFVYYYVKMIKHSLKLIKDNNKKGKLLLSIYVILAILILASIIFNLVV